MRGRITFACLALTVVGLRVCPAAEAVNVIDAQTINDARQPQAAIGDDRTIYVAFGAAKAIYCCKSTDGAKSFGKPVKVGEVKELALGMRRGPRIVVAKGNIVITALGHEDGNALAWRSGDQGESWEGPIPVNDAPGAAREGLHAMAVSPSGTVFCVWLDFRNESMQIYGAASEDGGASWSQNRRIYQSPDKNVCECCHPSVTYDSAGNLHVMWRNSIGGYRDMYRTASHDGGKTFDAAIKLGEGTWELDACPMDGGCIVATGPDQVSTIWRRERQVFRTAPNSDHEELLADGEQPWAAATKAGVHLVWIDGRPGELWLMKPGSKEPMKLASDATDPMVTAANGSALVVWESGTKNNHVLKAQVIGMK